MNSKNYIVLAVVCCFAFFSKVNAQEKAQAKLPVYKFHFKHEAKKDSMPSLYCVMNLADVLLYDKLSISYNDKTKVYPVKNSLTGKSDNILIEGNLVYFKIIEKLDVPFVIIEGIDKNGFKSAIYEQDLLGNIKNPVVEKFKWKKSKERVDSMDYVRNFENVFIGKDGKPRYKDINGRVYIIEKSSTQLEN